MYFVPELLMKRKKGKFAKCWLASKLSRVHFSRKYHRETISQIDVTKTCDQLIPHIVGIDANVRFSLSLSADLMLGIAKIYLYQSDFVLQQCVAFWTMIKSDNVDTDDSEKRKKKRRKDIRNSDDMFLLPPLEIAITETDFMKNLAKENDITLIDIGNKNNAFEATMQAADQLNFGALTGEQMDQLFQPGGLFSDSPSSVRALPAPDVPLDLPLPEIESSTTSRIFKIPGTPKGRKTSRNGTGTVERAAQRSQSLDNIHITDVPLVSVEAPSPIDVIPPPGTPTKHKLPADSEVTSSPKRIRRGLQNEFDLDSTTERPIPVASSSVAPAVTAIPSDDEMNFGSLDENMIADALQQSRKKRKNKIFADVNTQLPQQDLRHAMDNLFFQTRTFTALEDRVRRNIMSAEELLTVPSTGNKRWGKNLLINYEMMILEPISQTLPIDSGLRALDLIREPDLSTERSGELSGGAIGKSGVSTYDTSSKEHSKTLEVIPIGGISSTPRIEVPPIQEYIYPLSEQEILPKLPDYLPVAVEEPPRTPTQRKSLANYPKAIRNIVRDWSENGSTNKDSENRYEVESGEKISAIDSIQRTSTGSLNQPESSSSSGRSQEILDLLGRLESLWSEHPVITFKEICPVDMTNKKQGSVMFTNLLELSRLKEVKLTQASPYSQICIQKYSPYF